MRLRAYILAALLAVWVIDSSIATRAMADDEAIPRIEMKKFRFRRSKKKNFERLVVEFTEKEKLKRQPVIRVSPVGNGKEAVVQIEQVNLIGAIPEALINDSYVPKSKFLGPVSINTDGPVAGFNIRTFLKEAVSVDAFWLERPARLVLDVFPANSPRVEGRVPESEFRTIASVKHKAEPQSASPFACYPVSAAVSASVNFRPEYTPPAPIPVGEATSTDHQGPEPVICFLASSRVVVDISFKTKNSDNSNYVQVDPRNLASVGSGMGTSPFPAFPAPPPPPAPPKQNKPGMIITDVPPGRTPLGSQLVNPNTVQRIPVSQTPTKVPAFGDAPPAAQAPAFPPPIPTAPTTAPRANLNPGALLPPIK